MGEEMEGRKVAELTLQARLNEAAGHIGAAREILDSLAGGVEIGADLIASDTMSRNGDSASILEEEE